MSILGNILAGLTSGGSDTAAKPCSNCAGDCPVCPAACGECKPYKEQLIDALYNVEHLDEFTAKYEVVDASAAVGGEACPYCGGNNPSDAIVCEYCGSALREGTAKIRVTSASQIPDPIQQAQDVIFERFGVVEKYSDSDSGGLLESLKDLLTGEDGSAPGSRMSTDEIRTVAAEYGVSVSEYLQGLDNGRYLTASAKAKKEKAEALSAAIPLGTAAGALGTATVMRNRTGSGLFGSAQQPYMPSQGVQRPPVQHRAPQGQPHHGASGSQSRPVNSRSSGGVQTNIGASRPSTSGHGSHGPSAGHGGMSSGHGGSGHGGSGHGGRR